MTWFIYLCKMAGCFAFVARAVDKAIIFSVTIVVIPHFVIPRGEMTWVMKVIYRAVPRVPYATSRFIFVLLLMYLFGKNPSKQFRTNYNLFIKNQPSGECRIREIEGLRKNLKRLRIEGRRLRNKGGAEQEGTVWARKDSEKRIDCNQKGGKSSKV